MELPLVFDVNNSPVFAGDPILLIHPHGNRLIKGTITKVEPGSPRPTTSGSTNMRIWFRGEGGALHHATGVRTDAICLNEMVLIDRRIASKKENL